MKMHKLSGKLKNFYAVKVSGNWRIIYKFDITNATGMSVTEAAKRPRVSRTSLSRLINGHAGISPEMALRLSKLFSTSIEIWINIQAQYDTWMISKKSHKIKVKPLDNAA